MKNYFIGDTHFGHRGISSKFRTIFSSDEQHDQTIFDNIMSVSNKRNTLWLLGDNIFKEAEFCRFDHFAARFAKVYVALGNHDHQGLARHVLKWPNVEVFGVIKKFGMWIQHTPMHPDELYGKFCVHGHTHNNVMTGHQYINVSCEQVNYKPISLEEIREICDSKRA